MLSNDNVLYISLGGILGYLFRVLIEHYLTKSRQREDRIANQLEKARLNFRETLIRSVEGLYPEWTMDINQVPDALRSSTQSIQSAVTTYSFYLSKEQSEQLHASFLKYKQAAEHDVPRMCSMAERFYTTDSVNNGRALLKSCLDNLFHHAA